MNGILNLDKPVGISSARAVGQVKRLLPRGTKIGHAGTLDPFATGVLLLLIGQATKSCEKLMDQPKQYDATVLLGATTETDDPESPRIPWPGDPISAAASPPLLPQIEHTLRSLIGQIQQQPPAYSAIHVKGRRAYDLARQGQAPTLPSRLVFIYGINLLDYTWPELRLRVDCGRGTYIRALARDIGRALNVGGHLIQLRRTRVGDFRIETSKTLEDISPENIEHCLTFPDSLKTTRSQIRGDGFAPPVIQR